MPDGTDRGIAGEVPVDDVPEVVVLDGDMVFGEVSPDAAEAIAVAIYEQFAPALEQIIAQGYLLVAFWIPLVLIIGSLWWFFRQFLDRYH